MIFAKHIEELMAEIAVCYPPERIAATKARLADFWAHRPAKDRLPYVVNDFWKRRRDWPAIPEAFTPVQKNLVEQLRGIIEHAVWNDDFVPTLENGLIQATIPAYFGAVEEKIEGSVHVKPMIADPSDVFTLAEIGYPPDSFGGELLAKMHFFREATGGRLPVAETDMQGPFSVASHIWGIQEFLLATLADPVEAQHLIERTTVAVREYYRLMRNAVEGEWSPCHCFPWIWMPSDAGVCLSEDLLVVVSPDVTRRFIVPAIDEIGKEFGRVLVHTCGNLNPTARALGESQTLMGVNCSSSETDIRILAETMGDRFIYIIHHALVHDPKLETLDIYGQARLFRETFGGGLTAVSLLNPVVGTCDPASDAEAIRDIFRAC